MSGPNCTSFKILTHMRFDCIPPEFSPFRNFKKNIGKLNSLTVRKKKKKKKSTDRPNFQILVGWGQHNNFFLGPYIEFPLYSFVTVYNQEYMCRDDDFPRSRKTDRKHGINPWKRKTYFQTEKHRNVLLTTCCTEICNKSYQIQRKKLFRIYSRIKKYSRVIQTFTC